MKIDSRIIKQVAFFWIVCIFTDLAMAEESPPTILEKVDTSVGIVTGIVAFITGIIGIPVAWITIKFTRHKIANLILQNEKIRRELAVGSSKETNALSADGMRIIVDGDHNMLSITTDPHVEGSLLIIINFAISLTLLMLIVYGKNVVVPLAIYFFGFPDDNFSVLVAIASSALPFLAGLLLFVPVVKDALQVRKILREDIRAPN